MAMDKKSLEERILAYLKEKGYKPTKYTEGLAYAVACAVIDEITTSAEVNGGSVPASGGAVSKAKVS